MNNLEEAIEFAKKRLISMAELDLLKRADAMANYKNISLNESTNWVESIKNAKTDYQIFRELKLYCTRQRRLGKPLEAILDNWLNDVIDEIIKPPKAMKGAREKSRGSEFFIWNLLEVVRQNFDLSISRNDASKRLSACDVLSAAINEVNRKLSTHQIIRPTSYSGLKKLYTRNKLT